MWSLEWGMAAGDQRAWAGPQVLCSHSGPPGLGLTGGEQEGGEAVGSCHHQESRPAPPQLVGWLNLVSHPFHPRLLLVLLGQTCDTELANRKSLENNL